MMTANISTFANRRLLAALGMIVSLTTGTGCAVPNKTKVIRRDSATFTC